MRKALALALSILLASPSFSAVAHAEAPETTADLRCLLVAFSIANNKETSQIGMMAGLYYLGRLDGRDPDLNLLGKLSDPKALMGDQSLSDVAKACGEKMIARGDELQRIGARLMEIEKAQQATKGQKGL